MKNILEVCLSPDLGGLELHMKQLSAFLKADAVVNRKGKLKERFKQEGLPYLELNRFSFFKLAKIIDDKQIDVIHMHWTNDMLTVVLAKLLSKRKPKIVQTRHMHITRYKNDFYHRFLYKNLDAMIAVTRQVKNQLEKFIPQDIAPKIIQCYVGSYTPRQINTTERVKLKQSLGLKDEFVVCVASRIEKGKGQHIVLEAVDKLRQQGHNVTTLLLGHYMEKSYFDSLKKRYPKDIFTGFIPNPMQTMQIADCLVLASENETFGLVLSEAMKCGICVLGSNRGGPLEIINDAETGLLFEVMNSNDLSAKLQRIVTQPALRQSLASKGQERANKLFDAEKQYTAIGKILVGDDYSSFNTR